MGGSYLTLKLIKITIVITMSHVVTSKFSLLKQINSLGKTCAACNVVATRGARGGTFWDAGPPKTTMTPTHGITGSKPKSWNDEWGYRVCPDKQSLGGTTRTKALYKGPIRHTGHRVYKGELLVIQRYPMYHPGLYVDIQTNPRGDSSWDYYNLRSLVDGTVYVTAEEFIPDTSLPVTQTFYSSGRVPKYHHYYHVIPDEQSNKFKLIDSN